MIFKWVLIMQEGAPVAYFSKKLNAAQRNYSTIEKELLSIVETLKEYRTMLFGCRELHIYTDHKNLTFNKLVSQKIMRWQLFIEEFHTTFHYIQGTNNNIADALSRLPRIEGQSLVIQPASPGDMVKPVSPSDIQYPPASTPVDVSTRTHHTHFSSNECWSHSGFSSNASDDDETFRYAFSVTMDVDDMLECLLNFPDMEDNVPRQSKFQPTRTMRTFRLTSVGLNQDSRQTQEMMMRLFDMLSQ